MKNPNIKKENLAEKFITIFLAVAFSVFVGEVIRTAFLAGNFLNVFIFTIFGLVFIVLFPIFLISIFKIPQFKKGNLISSAHSIVTATIITATLGPALILSIKSDLVIFLFLMVCVIILILASFLGYYCTLKIKR